MVSGGNSSPPWKLNKVLVPTLLRHPCQVHVSSYPYIQSMPENTLWLHKNTCYFHIFQIASTASKPELQEISPKLRLFLGNGILGHLLFFLQPAGGTSAPTRTPQPLQPLESEPWVIYISLLFLPAQEALPLIYQPHKQQLCTGKLSEKQLCLAGLKWFKTVFL